MELHSEYNEYRVSVPQEFESVFTHFYFAENSSEASVTKTLLPTYQTILLFCFGENATMSTREKTIISIDKCVVFGPVRQAFEYTFPAGCSIMAANFKDDAFYRFFGKTSIEHSVRHPDELLEENCFTDLWHQLMQLDSTTEQVNHILEFCRPYLQHQDSTSQLLSSFDNHLLNPVKVIAEQTQQTERNIQRKQKEQFGYSLKELNRYNRFLKAIKIIEEETEKQKQVKWFTIIDECGYYDQSQLIHDFKHFINISPAQYLKFQQEICNPKSQ
ncbi:helix-turn-helix domain-containing protein [Chryseobacterium candidae]|uniref:AraC family transcriptional regulator n=1 Tax=Chryseobacterium candidae TaxID=1978493 RepID=A0ABY2R7H9_9FLAO|nr:AraC family transcriptional regulator [Chryseobacterium candidae]THV60534.1 AraC family transcriptional regulator [Chryseobacterium candidae]